MTGSERGRWATPTFSCPLQIQKSVIQVTPIKSSLHEIKVNNKIRYSTNSFLTHHLVRVLGSDGLHFNCKVHRGRPSPISNAHATKQNLKLGCVCRDAWNIFRVTISRALVFVCFSHSDLSSCTSFTQ